MEDKIVSIISSITISRVCYLEINVNSSSDKLIDFSVDEDNLLFFVKFIFNDNCDYSYFLDCVSRTIKQMSNVSRETLLELLNSKVSLIQKGFFFLKGIDSEFQSSPIRKIIVKVKNQHGLHARPTTVLTKIVQRFQSKIWIKKNKEQIVNARDFLQVLTLEIKNNDVIEILSQGPDSGDALICLEQAFEEQLSDDFYAKFLDGIKI